MKDLIDLVILCAIDGYERNFYGTTLHLRNAVDVGAYVNGERIHVLASLYHLTEGQLASRTARLLKDRYLRKWNYGGDKGSVVLVLDEKGVEAITDTLTNHSRSLMDAPIPTTSVAFYECVISLSGNRTRREMLLNAITDRFRYIEEDKNRMYASQFQRTMQSNEAVETLHDRRQLKLVEDELLDLRALFIEVGRKFPSKYKSEDTLLALCDIDACEFMHYLDFGTWGHDGELRNLIHRDVIPLELEERRQVYQILSELMENGASYVHHTKDALDTLHLSIKTDDEVLGQERLKKEEEEEARKQAEEQSEEPEGAKTEESP